MGKVHSTYVCQQCGYTQSQWAGRCPGCDSWNTLVETVAEPTRPLGKGRPGQTEGKFYRLSEVKAGKSSRILTGNKELDNVLGGGLVPGLVVLVAGEPGIGKSTLLTQIALEISGSGKGDTEVLYVCGEESASQVAIRVSRLKKDKKDEKRVTLMESADADEIVTRMAKERPEVVVVDSIQTLTTGDLSGVAGSVGQVRECAGRITSEAKRLGIPVFIVGHVTKQGSVAGPAVLMHIVDTVLWFEGEKGQNLRLLRAVKNRFGPTDEVGVFEMTGGGLFGISDPSRLLLAERVDNTPGSVVSVVLEGRRPILVEIQALVLDSQLTIPRRVATGVDFARMQMLLAVLMKRAGLHLEGSDVFVNVTGGIKLADRGIDLAICLAIASSFMNKSLKPDIAAVGEIGLLGEVRKVTGLERRVKEAKKLGFRVASAESGKNLGAAIEKLLKD